ncbi:MAG: delta 1-pyrroline-5-carboxylate synthetase, partial [Methanobrevibacter sp.]|nr:delta 1-pyrroline-5-carboxylate synthetase [Methanobrevibacter sp.]
MIIIIKQVVKIGGSLFPKYAIELAKHLKNTNSCIVVGGGEFANLIRKYDEEFKFSDETNHWRAIDCMDIIAKLVNDKVKSCKLAYSLKDIE